MYKKCVAIGYCFVALFSIMFLGAFRGKVQGGCKEYGEICDFIENLKEEVRLIATESEGNTKELLEEYVEHVLDLAGISKFVMGNHWTTASESQREKFSEAYGRHIKRVYAAQLAKYSLHHMTVMYVHPIGDDRYAIGVRLNDPADEEDFLMLEFHLIQHNEALDIVDIKVNNSLSISINQRSIISDSIKKSGLDKTIAYFEEESVAK